MVHFLLEAESRFKYTDFSGYLKGGGKSRRVLQSAKNMYRGDMWDKGVGYIGPLPKPDDENANEMMANMKRRFTGRNVIEELVDRSVDCLLSRSPDWKIYDKKAVIKRSLEEAQRRRALKQSLEQINLSLTQLIAAAGELENIKKEVPQISEKLTAEEKKIAEAEVILSEAWVKLELGDKLKASVTDHHVVGEGNLRIHLSRNYDERALAKIQAADNPFIEALKYLRVEFCENDDAKIIDDDGEKLSIAKLNGGKKKLRPENIEITFVDDDDLTYIATFKSTDNPLNTSISATSDVAAMDNSGIPYSQNETDTEVSELIQKLKASNADVSTGFFLDGEILVGQVKGKPFVSESMLQLNRSLNLDLTLASHALVETGMPELFLTNVEDEDEDNPGKKIEIKRGTTAVNNLVGVQSVDEKGVIHFETPGLHFKPPTPMQPYIQGADLYYFQLLGEGRQIFVLSTKDASQSGESRIQARQDFLKKNERYKPRLDNHGTWLLTTLLHLVAAISGKNRYFEGLGISFDSKVYAGELTSSEKESVVSQYEKGLLDRESAMVLLGVEDPILAIDKIRLDQAEKLEQEIRKLVATSQTQALVAANNPNNDPAQQGRKGGTPAARKVAAKKKVVKT